MSNNLINEIQLLTNFFVRMSSQWPDKVDTFCINTLKQITFGDSLRKGSNMESISLKTFRLVKETPSNLGPNQCKSIIKWPFLRSH